MASKKQTGPAFLRDVAPIIETLNELGSSGNAVEVAETKRLGARPVERDDE